MWGKENLISGIVFQLNSPLTSSLYKKRRKRWF